MKICDLEKIINIIDDLKLIGDRLDYNESCAINQGLMKIKPYIKDEMDRMKKDGIEINSPKIYIERIVNPDVNNAIENLQTQVNTKLQELVQQDYKIIDYNVALNINDLYSYFWIKYTN